jgi:hypothetical protein
MDFLIFYMQNQCPTHAFSISDQFSVSNFSLIQINSLTNSIINTNSIDNESKSCIMY